jgi:DNA-binding CsgD family transcriptional regulator
MANDMKPARKCLTLSSRQQQVLELISQGKTMREIGELLGVKFATVNTHMRRLYKKLGVENRTCAAIAFITGKHLKSNQGHLAPENPPEWLQICVPCAGSNANMKQTALLK